MIRDIERAMSDDTKSMSDIAKIIERDPVVCSRLFQLVNSPALRGYREITTVKDALTAIGINVAKHLILAVFLRDRFSTVNRALSALVTDLFVRSVDMSVCGKGVAQELQGDGFDVDPDVVGLGGLMYHVGALPIIAYFEANPIEDVEVVQSTIRAMRAEATSIVFSSWNICGDVGLVVTSTDRGILGVDVLASIDDRLSGVQGGSSNGAVRDRVGDLSKHLERSADVRAMFQH